MLKRILLVSCILYLVSCAVWANVSPVISFQGRLTDSGGVPITVATTATFTFYNAETSGNTVGTVNTKTITPDSNGFFSTTLDVNGIDFNNSCWVEVTVGSSVLSPRQLLTGSPYAAALSDGNKSINGVLYVSKGIYSTAEVSGGYAGVFDGKVRITGSLECLGLTNLRMSNISIESAVNFPLYSVATATSGTNYGVYGKSNSSTGYGVAGYGGYYGVYGNGRYGVWGASRTSASSGIFGYFNNSSAATGYGVVGNSLARAGIGVYGTAETGVLGYGKGRYGVYGNSQNGFGVFGTTSATYALIAGVCGSVETAASGVYGRSLSGAGVYGKSTSGSGIIGTSTSGNGIYGESNTGYAGYFEGNVAVLGNLSVDGTLTKGGGAFEIEHPLDPQNKILRHSFVESPDMKNVYDGIAVLDNNGVAIIELPAYFDALNKDYRYQLTTLGEYAPVYIQQEIKKNTFMIAGGKPGMKVSWQVTGIRQDTYAKEHPIVVEEAK